MSVDIASDSNAASENNIAAPQGAPVNPSRRRFLTAATTVLGGIGAAYAAAPFICSWLPSAKAKALGAPIEIDISKLEPGAQMTVEWRGQPVWIVRRTKETLDKLAQLDKLLRDPNSVEDQQPAYAQNPYRSIKPEYLVLIGLCTHLGCVPTYRPEIGGVGQLARWFFLPRHGSKFDMAGRVFKGVPAPFNLVVPPYLYVTILLIIGEDKKAAYLKSATVKA